MRPTRSVLRLVIGVAAVLALALTGGSPAAAATSPSTTGSTVSATWELVDYDPNRPQRICTPSDFARAGLYFLVSINGTWSTPITSGVANLPPGAAPTPNGFIPPGSSDRGRVLSAAPFSVASTPVGRYHSVLWASDGRVTQTVPVIIDFQERC
ncbi:DUF5980 family protein [Plantactinospora sp. BC1]|uniref:DUF5980 family protein n=1 Tax=Plantactinospora sp. BC1 TaxID=2108470 RepID=UPI00131EF79C|nr:DUF5980 family protein [Plantactinospora sp. BC1]